MAWLSETLGTSVSAVLSPSKPCKDAESLHDAPVHNTKTPKSPEQVLLWWVLVCQSEFTIRPIMKSPLGPRAGEHREKPVARHEQELILLGQGAR